MRKKLSILLCTLLLLLDWPTPAKAAVSFDATNATVAVCTTCSTNAVGITIASNSNIFLVIQCKNVTVGYQTPSSTKWNTSETATQITFHSRNANVAFHTAGLVNPTTGAHNADCNYAGSALSIANDAASFYGVNQATPTRAVSQANGNSTTPSVAVSNGVAGDMVIDQLETGAAVSIVSTQTAVYSAVAANTGLAMARVNATGSDTMGYTINASGTWVLDAFALQAAASSTNQNMTTLGVGGQ